MLSGFLLFFGYLPSAGPKLFAPLADVEAALPFAVRFTLTRGAPAVALVMAQALLIMGAVLRWALKRPRLGRLSMSLALLLAAGTTGVGARAITAVSRLTAYPLGAGLQRCACPALEALARECHCDPAGALREVFYRTEDLAGTTLADRLIYHSAEPSSSRWIKRSPSPEGAIFSLSDGTELRCRYASACAAGRDCGPCRFDPPASAPIQVELRPELHCADVRTGTRALGQRFLHLRRRVWRDTTDGAPLPAALDPAAALTTPKSELIGSPRADQASALDAILTGGGRAPALRLGGVRECRSTARGLGMLAEALEVEVEPLERLIVRVEAVDDDAGSDSEGVTE